MFVQPMIGTHPKIERLISWPVLHAFPQDSMYSGDSIILLEINKPDQRYDLLVGVAPPHLSTCAKPVYDKQGLPATRPPPHTAKMKWQFLSVRLGTETAVGFGEKYWFGFTKAHLTHPL